MKASTTTGSVERVIRSLFQAAVASPAAFAALLAASPLSATQDAKVVGIVGAIYVFVSAVHNALEGTGVIPAMLRYVPPATPEIATQLSVTGSAPIAASTAKAVSDALTEAVTTASPGIAGAPVVTGTAPLDPTNEPAAGAAP